MYQRVKKWLDAITPTTKSESGWENTFTIEEKDAIDIRFKLKGYGWKPNASDENLPALEKGSYRIYYRLVGESDWTFLLRAESDRADNSVAQVYRDIGVAVGQRPAGQYEIKIVADKGARFTSWGGSVEGISSGEQFWSNLEVRTKASVLPESSDEVTVTENVGVNIV